MRATADIIRINADTVNQALVEYIGSFESCAPLTLKLYRATILRFLRCAQDPHGQMRETLAIDEELLFEWMQSESKNVTVGRAAAKFCMLNRFLVSLKRVGLISDNPMARIRSLFGKNGWNGIAAAMKSNDYREALNRFRVEPDFHGILGSHMRAYLEHKRALGAKYRTEGQTLAGFDRFLQKKGITSVRAITQDVIQHWLGNMTCAPITFYARLRLLGRFFDHLMAFEVVTHNPAASAVVAYERISQTPYKPYIFSQNEVAHLLREAQRLPNYCQFPLRHQTIHMVVTLLYSLGLRIGEVCRLSINDVDLDRGTLFIRKTKFNKSRTVAFGQKLQACLEQYLDVRRTVFPPLRIGDPLFVAFRRRPLSQTAIRRSFRILLKKAGITPSHEKGRPRIHDLRHTFAVHRLLKWYRDGIDVQAKLPLLSTFMGHIDMHSTQVYLSITMELLDEANKRFANKFEFMSKEAK